MIQMERLQGMSKEELIHAYLALQNECVQLRQIHLQQMDENAAIREDSRNRLAIYHEKHAKVEAAYSALRNEHEKLKAAHSDLECQRQKKKGFLGLFR